MCSHGADIQPSAFSGFQVTGDRQLTDNDTDGELSASKFRRVEKHGGGWGASAAQRRELPSQDCTASPWQRDPCPPRGASCGSRGPLRTGCKDPRATVAGRGVRDRPRGRGRATSRGGGLPKAGPRVSPVLYLEEGGSPRGGPAALVLLG